MRKTYIFITICILLAFNLSLSKPHKCLQDELDIELGFTDTEENNERGRMLLSERENMRVTFDFSSLDQFTGDMIPLAKEVKRQTEISGQFFSNNLKVNRQRSNLKFPYRYSQCSDYTVPEKDKTTGIANSDLHIYVNVFNQNSSVLAYATPCILNYGDGRPVFGVFAINLAHFSIKEVGKGDEFENNFETIAHELTHILGFSRSMYQYFINPATGRAYGRQNVPIVTQTVRGISTQWITTPKVKQLARDYYGCPTAIGMQLENQGGSGSANSHWERTVLENDYMTASAIGHDAVFSKFTFALLEDSGWYTPTYEYVDDIDWGKGQGCDFLYDCSTNKFREFNEEARSCNFYHSSIAANYGDRFADYCKIPQVIQNLYCSDSDNTSQNDKYTGNTFALESRCFESNILDKRVSSNGRLSDHRCMEYKCNADATQIQITVMGEKYTLEKKNNKVLVEPKGNNKYIQGYVNGPEDWNGFCNTYPLPCPNYCSSYGYCLAKTCHCDANRAGKDCSVECPNSNYIFNGKCLNSQQCPQGTSVHKPTKECLSNSTNNSTEPSISDEPEENRVCKQDEFLNLENKCEKCTQNCTGCVSQNVCNKCSEGYKLKQYTNEQILCEEITIVPTCEKGQYLTKFNKCEECRESCETCSDYNICESCKEGYILRANNMCEEIPMVPTCEKGQYLSKFHKCEECRESCESCSDYNICESCKQGYILRANNMCEEIPMVPTCEKGQYLTKLNKCEECRESCETCSDYNICESCKEGYILRANNLCEEIPMVPTCEKGQYLTKLNKCEECRESCETCSDYNICESCKEGYFLSSNNKCSKCYYGCSSCTQFTVCQTCKLGYKFVNYFNHRYCQNECPTGFFEKNGECYYE